MSSDSWRCLIILPMTSRISGSLGLSRSAPGVSRARIAALTMRSVETRRAWPAFIASFIALLISSRNTAMASRKCAAPATGRRLRRTFRPLPMPTQPLTGAPRTAQEWDEPAPTALLVLADGTVLEGIGFGATGQAAGEVCFNTAMTGYEEILTDPSYAGQIITFTFPHIGNVGTNEDDIETVNLAATPGARGIVLHSAITEPSNYRATKHLDAWLKNRGVIGLCGIDTRALTALIRDKGMPNAVIAHAADGTFDRAALAAEAAAWPGIDGMDLAPSVTSAQRFTWDQTTWQLGLGYGRRGKTLYNVVAVDYGIKSNI